MAAAGLETESAGEGASEDDGDKSEDDDDENARPSHPDRAAGTGGEQIGGA